MVFMSSAVNLGASAPSVCEVGVGVFAFHDDGEVPAFSSRMAFAGCGDVLGGFDDGNAGAGVFGEADFGAGLGVGADGLHAEAVGEHGVMANLGDACGRELEAGRVAAVCRSRGRRRCASR